MKFCSESRLARSPTCRSITVQLPCCSLTSCVMTMPALQHGNLASSGDRRVQLLGLINTKAIFLCSIHNLLVSSVADYGDNLIGLESRKLTMTGSCQPRKPPTTLKFSSNIFMVGSRRTTMTNEQASRPINWPGEQHHQLKLRRRRRERLQR